MCTYYSNDVTGRLHKCCYAYLLSHKNNSLCSCCGFISNSCFHYLPRVASPHGWFCEVIIAVGMLFIIIMGVVYDHKALLIFIISCYEVSLILSTCIGNGNGSILYFIHGGPIVLFMTYMVLHDVYQYLH